VQMEESLSVELQIAFVYRA